MDCDVIVRREVTPECILMMVANHAMHNPKVMEPIALKLLEKHFNAIKTYPDLFKRYVSGYNDKNKVRLIIPEGCLRAIWKLMEPTLMLCNVPLRCTCVETFFPHGDYSFIDNNNCLIHCTGVKIAYKEQSYCP